MQISHKKFHQLLFSLDGKKTFMFEFARSIHMMVMVMMFTHWFCNFFMIDDYFVSISRTHELSPLFTGLQSL